MQFNFIANTRVPSASGRTLAVVDPSDGLPFEEIQRSQARDIDDAVAAARDGFDGVWSQQGAAERGRLLLRLSQQVTEHAGELAAIVQQEAGKTTRHAAEDVAALAACFAMQATACAQLQTETTAQHGGYKLLHWRTPHGVTGHFIPWHTPLQSFGQSVGSALVAGNACVVKPAEETSLALLRLAELATAAGFPAGVINIVTGHDQEIAEALARHKRVDHLSLGGSRQLNTLVQQVAAERQCPVLLRASGARAVTGPQIVFADADLATATRAIVDNLLRSAGQRGSVGSRLLIENAAYEPMLAQLEIAFDALQVGPAQRNLDMGPLIRHSQQQHVWDFLSDAHAAGISLVAQGSIVEDAPETGFYQAPTLLRDLPRSHVQALKDVPGPVLATMPFDTEAEVFDLLNGTASASAEFGLWSSDAARPLRLARGLHCARLGVNDHGPGANTWVEGFDALQEALAYTGLKTVAVRQA